MSNSKCETTLVSQLLDSIDNNLKLIHLPMEQIQSSADNDELCLSGHRSIFSSYESHCRKIPPSFRDSQYEGFHWDLYEDRNYHHLTFECEQENPCQTTSLSDWSMHLNSDDTEDDVDDTTSSSSNPPQTSWHAIKAKSLHQSSSSSTNTSESGHYSPNPLTLYRLFQHTKSRQHPCHLYQNFSDRSLCDSSTSSTSYTNSVKQKKKVPMPRIKLKRPTTFSQLKSNQSSIEQLSSKSNVDQCLQTSAILSPNENPTITRTKSTDRLLNKNPNQLFTTSRHSLPDLDFLTYYAKENPIPLSTPTKHFCTAIKSPLLLTKKPTHTVFYCSIQSSNRPISKPRTLKEIKRIKNIKTSPTTLSTEEIETFSSECSSTSSSSGYFSNSSTNQPRHIQTPSSSYPLKSCLKRTTTNALPEDVFTLSTQFLPKKIESSKHRRYSTPAEQKLSLQYRAEIKTCTFSEHDLRAKKSVSFCDEIARRLITPSASPKYQYQDYCDLVPRESLTDSPPSEFNLSDENEDQLINFTESIPDDLTKPLPIKYGSDKYLIDAFANTILRILEIKCSDSKSYYLNNQTNPELDRTLRQDFCPLLREVLEDGLRQYSGSLFSKKINLWRLIDLTTPTIGRLNEAKTKAQNGLPSSADWIEKFNSFIYHLLNLHELASWLTHFLSHRTLLKTYYESWAFVLVNINNDLFENLTNQLEKLSPLPFRLKYQISLTNQRLSSSILAKKFNVRAWLRDRKTQVKIPSTSSVPPNISIRRKFNSIPVSKRH